MAKKKKKPEKKYRLEISEKQAYLLQEATELFARIMMAQFDHISYTLHINHNLPTESYHKLSDSLRALEHLIYDHTSRRRSDLGDISWDLYQVIRHRLAWDNFPGGGITVNFHAPMRYSEEELAKIEEID